ncbi:PrpF protein-domain-containing protein [Suillus clintonianus]|uniref:PrpF protein-domain-containing protein n=1 Tax=Suillus clintonianus TaxID=1904413 RepID=UPI001B86F134|nr:PrpF protein-domain-containing protein [Suillus clintonianus]KAG2125508.1 PrpF protein-domain-containing protein [Suillus clintonianus]
MPVVFKSTTHFSSKLRSHCVLQRMHRRFTTLNPIPATFLRGGTSKGVFLNRAHLPEDQSQWAPIFLGIMGSPDTANGLQINGMGGGISSLSKICVVGPASAEQKVQGIDAEYTFVQVGIRDATIDLSGNCGNLSSMVGVFAMDEGFCSRDPSTPSGTTTSTIRLLNTNTNKTIDTTFPVTVADYQVQPKLDLLQTTMAGVPGKASQITLEFISPGGARTGKLLPTGKPLDSVYTHDQEIPVSLIDATNPTVFVAYADLSRILRPLSLIDFSAPDSRKLMESIRRAALSPSCNPDHDIGIHAFSMGVLHKAVPMTVGLCLGVAAKVGGTLAWHLTKPMRLGKVRESELIRIKHPSGIVEVGADFGADGEVLKAKVVRTGRRIMKGVVWW